MCYVCHEVSSIALCFYVNITRIGIRDGIICLRKMQMPPQGLPNFGKKCLGFSNWVG